VFAIFLIVKIVFFLMGITKMAACYVLLAKGSVIGVGNEVDKKGRYKATGTGCEYEFQKSIQTVLILHLAFTETNRHQQPN